MRGAYTMAGPTEFEAGIAPLKTVLIVEDNELNMKLLDDDLRAIPVIAVTAFAMKGDEEKIREGGCEAYISKPISVVSFLETIDGFLKGRV